MLHKFWKVKAATGEVVTQFASDSLSPPNGERAGVRGKYLKIKHLLTPEPPSSIEEKEKNQIAPLPKPL